jgi:hypothetical protein
MQFSMQWELKRALVGTDYFIVHVWHYESVTFGLRVAKIESTHNTKFL